jgi:hypothetical protein
MNEDLREWVHNLRIALTYAVFVAVLVAFHVVMGPLSSGLGVDGIRRN